MTELDKIKAEAVKRVKEWQRASGCCNEVRINEFINFFNLTEEDLK